MTNLALVQVPLPVMVQVFLSVFMVYSSPLDGVVLSLCSFAPQAHERSCIVLSINEVFQYPKECTCEVVDDVEYVSDVPGGVVVHCSFCLLQAASEKTIITVRSNDMIFFIEIPFIKF